MLEHTTDNSSSPISNCYSSWTAKEWEEERWYADAWMSHPSALSLALASGPRAFNLPGRQILLRNISDWQQSYEGFTLQPTLDVVTALLHVGTKVSEEDRRVARSLARGVNSFGNAIEPQPMFADAVEKHLSDLSKVPPRVDAVLGSRWSAGDSSNIVDVEGDEGDDDVRSLLIARQSADRDFLDADDIHELGLLRGNNSRLKIVKPVARPATANSTTPIAPPTGYSEVGSPLTEHSALYAEQGRHLAEAQKVIAALSVSAKEREVANAEERALLAAERLAQLSLVEAQARVIAEQSKEIARIGEIVRERERELAEMEKVVVKHQGTVERLERELTIEKEVGEGLQREMAMERDRNIDLQRDHKDQRLEISELQQLLHSANGQISDLELSLQAAENSIADLEREFTQERNRNVTIQSEGTGRGEKPNLISRKWSRHSEEAPQWNWSTHSSGQRGVYHTATLQSSPRGIFHCGAHSTAKVAVVRCDWVPPNTKG
ncbi:hypothetical protein M427DRAFT_287182 [Gonapodya prolifera JEL478]|uniref:Uncharacterized protein n=1 Tax=Gonapodya prolifera (strain JEL478) TaxID=1344416 RepID=A0A138ZWK6_GONPJ|nr:hypothetical protein M427DRAFT_287182 [Gonapodya prolifera JEL478]|eukprot:KXS08882.1 hypothetical protein M427DRAFT_287182 [Gonapodya prolifera JEL478]